MRHDAPLAVKLPLKDHDKPGWGKVGIIAAVGFVIGVAWPKVAGVRLGPSAPGEAASAAAAAASITPPHPAEVPDPKGAAPRSASAAPPGAPPPALSVVPNAPPARVMQVTVGKGSVLSCKTEDGETKKGHKECGALASLDAVVAPRLRKLASCSGAEGQTGKVSVVVTADFAQGKLTHDIGKSSTVANVDAFAACVRTQLSGLTLDRVAHEHARYTVGYNANVAQHDDASPAASAATTATDAPRARDAPPKDVANAGEAQIVWDVALVRDAPKTGEIVGRLPRGTKVKLGQAKDGWFAVKFGEGFASDGWIYRSAIGR